MACHATGHQVFQSDETCGSLGKEFAFDQRGPLLALAWLEVINLMCRPARFVFILLMVPFFVNCADTHRGSNPSAPTTAIPQSPATSSGTESGGGGGDPDAIEFLRLSSEFADWVESDKGKTVDVTALSVRKLIKSIQESLNGPGKAKLQFTSEKVFDQNGVEKMAVFDRGAQSILLQRGLWEAQLPGAKYDLVEIEVLGVLGSSSRYTDTVKASSSSPDTSQYKNTLCGTVVEHLMVLPANVADQVKRDLETRHIYLETCKFDGALVLVSIEPQFTMGWIFSEKAGDSTWNSINYSF